MGGLSCVALRKESVDRNGLSYFYIIKVTGVALRKESVDRNILAMGRSLAQLKSLSARRAWIEIAIVNTVISCIMGRSPQGERG